MGRFPDQLIQFGDGVADSSAKLFVPAIRLRSAGEITLDPFQGPLGSFKRRTETAIVHAPLLGQ
jgi:hypothetical protein